MARLPRLVLPGALYHLIQRGNNRAAIVQDDVDRKAYLDALRESAKLHDVQVHAYALMDNHVHLLLTPMREDSLARALQTLGRRYVIAFNRRHGRSGTLWEGRFRTALIEAPAFFMDLLRYVEQQPVRAGLCDDPADYPWSSAAHHMGRRRDPLVHEHAGYWALGNTPFEREAKYRLAMAAPLPPAQLERVRRHVHSGWPLLSAEAAKSFELTQGRPSAPRKRGRPVQTSPVTDSIDSDPI